MPKLSELDTADSIKMFLFANSGVGKTCFASTWPGPIYFFDFDGKISSAKEFLQVRKPEKINDIDFDQFRPLPTVSSGEIFTRFQQKLMEMEQQIKDGKFGFKTVVFDSCTLFWEALMRWVIQTNPGIKRVSENVPAQHDYAIAGAQFRQVMLRLAAFPCNVLVTGHIKTEKDDETGRIEFKPSVSGRLTEFVPALFEEVYRGYVATDEEGKKVRLAQTNNDGKYDCRSQIQGIPEVINLSYRSIYEAKKKGKELAKQALQSKKQKVSSNQQQATA